MHTIIILVGVIIVLLIIIACQRKTVIKQKNTISYFVTDFLPDLRKEIDRLVGHQRNEEFNQWLNKAFIEKLRPHPRRRDGLFSPRGDFPAPRSFGFGSPASKPLIYPGSKASESREKTDQ